MCIYVYIYIVNYIYTCDTCVYTVYMHTHVTYMISDVAWLRKRLSPGNSLVENWCHQPVKRDIQYGSTTKTHGTTKTLAFFTLSCRGIFHKRAAGSHPSIKEAHKHLV